MESFKTYYQSLLTGFESYLAGAFPKLDAEVSILEASVNYSLLAGGKRVRPLIALMVLDEAGKELAPAYPMVAAIEYIHTYSLIHDDLPALDDDDLRRGRPTNHKVYGEDIALLAGDALLTEAFRQLAAPDTSALYGAETCLKVIRVLAEKAGNFGMVAGQVADVQAEKTQASKASAELLAYIHTNKTSQLLSASVEIGALLAGHDREQVQALAEYGLELGRCFQITDDILDVEGDEVKLGKPVGSDEKNAKLTYVSLFGLPRSKELAAEANQRAINALDRSQLKVERLKAMAEFLLKRNT